VSLKKKSRIIRWLVAALAVVLVGVTAAVIRAVEVPTRITLILTNDTMGSITPCG